MKKYCFLYFALIILMANCTKPYEPEAITAPNNFLVIDGYINADPATITTFKLSRTRSLVDSVPAIPEFNAAVSIQGKSGAIYNLSPTGIGVYGTTALTLSQNDQYRINVKTSDGHQYVSDFVEVKKTPAIDSITWEQKENVTLFVNTHDPTNMARYYKWDYVETWEYHSPLEGSLGVSNGFVIYTDSTNQTTKCWRDSVSTNIVIGTSIALNSDVITHQPVQTIIKNNQRITVRYSMLLNQYAITADAYNYWSIIQKNSQQLGTLFDLQPSQLSGNIHCTTNPNEPVIGFIGASTVKQKRVFIQNSQLSNWATADPHNQCDTIYIPEAPIFPIVYNNPNPDYWPFYFTSGPTLVLTKKPCVDCRTQGGVTTKPSYW